MNADNNDIAALESERDAITASIAELGSKKSGMLPGRQVPNGSSAKLLALNRQLATVKLKLAQAKAKAGNG